MKRAQGHDLDAAHTAAGTPLLLQPQAKGFAAGMLDDVAIQMAAALERLFADWGAKTIAVVPEPATLGANPPAWHTAIADPVFWQLGHAGLREPVELAASRLLVLQLIDLHYGGSGMAPAVPATWSSAGTHFANRMGLRLAQAFAQSWSEQLAGMPDLSTFTPHPPKSGSSGWTGPIHFQRFRISGLGKQAASMGWAFAAGDLDQIGAAQAAAAPPSRHADNGWLVALHRSLGQVMLPVRSVLARPEVNLGRVLALKVGDVIPLKMPEKAPISVAGYSFAAGTIGDVNGRAAISVETIRKGTAR